MITIIERTSKTQAFGAATGLIKRTKCPTLKEHKDACPIPLLVSPVGQNANPEEAHHGSWKIDHPLLSSL
jgi:hypothetical protein